MFRRDKWWHREIERVSREHAARETELIATICRLAGKPAPSPEPVPEPEPERDPGYDPVNPDFL